MVGADSKPDTPDLFFPGALALRGFSPDSLVFVYLNRRKAKYYLLAAFVWYALVLAVDERVFHVAAALGWAGVFVPLICDAAYIGGLFWIFCAAQELRTRVRLVLQKSSGKITFEFSRGNMLCCREWNFSEVIDILYYDGRGKSSVINSGGLCPCVRINNYGDFFRDGRDFSLWLAQWIGCGWCSLDRRGRISAHLPGGV